MVTKAEKEAKAKAEVTPEPEPTVETTEEHLRRLENLLLEAWSAMEEMGRKVDALNELYVQLATTRLPAKGARKFGGRSEPVKILDSETDELYDSKSACGRAVAASMGLDEKDNFVFYQMVKQAPERFVEQV